MIPLKHELPYFTVGSSFGGNQSFMTDPVMRMGGCGALAVCDSCIVLAREFGAHSLVPFDATDFSKQEYIAFGQSMKKYLPPRWSGINKLATFAEEAQQYFDDRAAETGEAPIRSICTVDHSVPWEEAARQLKEQLDRGIPVPTLLLRHKSRTFDFYEYHWFMATGYDDPGAETGPAEDFLVRFTTYGSSRWLSLRDMWDTGHPGEDGGFVFWDVEDTERK
ncbi:MAG: hypothetical protein IKX83_06840 [Clostridia bacterium]|nr:hypothetical protein [Clostridia bacterium]